MLHWRIEKPTEEPSQKHNRLETEELTACSQNQNQIHTKPRKKTNHN